MRSLEDIERQADATLNSVDHIQAVNANEFMHSRIMHRLQNRQTEERRYARVLKVAMALVLLTIVNITAFVWLNNNKLTGKKGIEAFASQYSLQPDTYSY